MVDCENCICKKYLEVANKRCNELTKQHFAKSQAFDALYHSLTDKHCVGTQGEEAVEMLRMYLDMEESRDFWFQVACCGILFSALSLYLMWK